MSGKEMLKTFRGMIEVFKEYCMRLCDRESVEVLVGEEEREE